MADYSNYIIEFDASCREAMKRLDKNQIKILFIVKNNILVAALTDGDIRRYLLNGGNIEDPVDKAGNKKPRSANNIEEAKTLFDRKNYIAIPIVDEKGAIINIFFGNDASRVYKKIDNVKVIINAGGRGTRLDPFTRVFPKPLIPVGEMPIIEHIMKEFGKYSLNEFSIIVNYKKELIKTYFAEADYKYGITWYDEIKPLGTGGGLSLLKGKLDGTFFFTNCDILLLADYESMIRYHKEHKNVITMVCAYKSVTIPYGVIDMGKNGTIENMKEKPELSFLTNTGMYIVEPEVLDDIEDGVPIGFPDIVKREQDKGKNVGIYPISEDEWLDMGQIDELEKMRKKIYGN